MVADPVFSKAVPKNVNKSTSGIYAKKLKIDIGHTVRLQTRIVQSRTVYLSD